MMELFITSVEGRPTVNIQGPGYTHIFLLRILKRFGGVMGCLELQIYFVYMTFHGGAPLVERCHRAHICGPVTHNVSCRADKGAQSFPS